MTRLLRRINFGLQGHRALINGLQLSEMRVEDANDVRDLKGGNTKYLAYISILSHDKKKGRGRARE